MRIYIPVIGVIAATAALSACTTDYAMHSDACLAKETIEGVATEVYDDYIVVTEADGSEFNVASKWLTRDTNVGDNVSFRRDVVAGGCSATPGDVQSDADPAYSDINPPVDPIVNPAVEPTPGT